MTTKLSNCLSELSSGDDERAEAAATGIIALVSQNTTEKILSALQGLKSSPDADTRWWAVRVLAAISDPQIPSCLVEALGDRDASVRQCAALGLRLQTHPNAIPALVDALADSDHLVAALAADALIEIGAPAVPALLEIMQNGSQFARLEAVRALATMRDERAIPALFSALDDNSNLVTYWADEGLERMGVGMVFFKPE